tara:strand:+ start:151 stop:477 length:327 start_codon:yes stop_codon:yes gene_type:complete
MTFQKTVLTVSIVLFILMMILIATMMTSAKKNMVYPPQTGQCPDFWSLGADGIKCYNTHNLGNKCTSPTDFSKMTLTQRCEFSKGCEIGWDGITNAEGKDGIAKYCKV